MERLRVELRDAEARRARQYETPPQGHDMFFPSTILRNVSGGMRVLIEETFGPLVSIIVVRGTEEAVKAANDTSFGLGASVFSDSLEAAESVAHQIRAGNITDNGEVVSDPRLPFGGVRYFGYSRELGRFGGEGVLERQGCGFQGPG